MGSHLDYQRHWGRKKITVTRANIQQEIKYFLN